jgi:hypothetical protein
MMAADDGDQEELGASAGLRDGFDQPGTPVAKRVFGGGESYSEISE